ncbi:MAG: protein-L-isoaspartate(D-aspartate) O-methyltransferase [Candidatus Zixiibacteriota bacterium]
MMFRKHARYNDVVHISRRMQMVDTQLVSRSIMDARVLAAMRTVPRHLFVPARLAGRAYDDTPLSIGHGQTISQPYVVASMTEHLELDRECKVLEVGTGCGYQSAVLAEIVSRVYTIEILPDLLLRANKLFHKLGYDNIKTMLGDGTHGWAKHATYDAIIVTATAPTIPNQLVEQLVNGGRMVLPIGDARQRSQELYKIRKVGDKIEKKQLYTVRFVPMTGEIEE